MTAVVISVTAVYAIKKKATSVRKTAIAASITVAVQILLGMLIVTSKLEPLLVAIHLSTGVLVFAMTLMTFISSYSRTKNNSYL
jgi:cytochrome c oxidase assembly protein subunit 15